MFMPKSTKKSVTTTEVKVTKKIVLEGVKCLKEQKITTTFELTTEIDPQTDKPCKVLPKKQIDQKVEVLRSFELFEVEPESLLVYRKNGIPSFVLKIDGKFFYAAIPNDLNFVSSALLGTHMCAAAGNECRRLSAASDEQGGCEKVRNRSNYIERYDFITTGYETFNTKRDSFVVINCTHHEKCPPRKKLTTTELNAKKLALAQHVWEDVETLAQVRARKEKNKNTIGMY